MSKTENNKPKALIYADEAFRQSRERTYERALFHRLGETIESQHAEIQRLIAERDALRARIAEAEGPAAGVLDGWQPIETAPRETELLVGKYVNNEWRICQSGFYYDAGNPFDGEPAFYYWHCDWDNAGVTDDDGPTHWMPLPAAPQPGEQRDGA